MNLWTLATIAIVCIVVVIPCAIVFARCVKGALDADAMEIDRWSPFS